MSAFKSDEEIWYWFQKIQEKNASAKNIPDYCRDCGVDYKKYLNMSFRIEWRKNSNPKLYAELCAFAEKFLASDMIIANFAKINNIKHSHLQEAVVHLKYLQVIERMKSEKGDSPMAFIHVPARQPRPPVGYQGAVTEVMEKQNDIEIIISKGVKVSISPNIDSMKIIKIIELLKDL